MDNPGYISTPKHFSSSFGIEESPPPSLSGTLKKERQSGTLNRDGQPATLKRELKKVMY